MPDDQQFGHLAQIPVFIGPSNKSKLLILNLASNLNRTRRRQRLAGLIFPTSNSNGNRPTTTPSHRKVARMLQRLNREQPGISGLMSFSQVIFTLIAGIHTSNCSHSRKYRPGESQRHIYILKTSKTSVCWLSSPVSALRSDVNLGKWRLSLYAYKTGLSDVRPAFLTVHRCRKLRCCWRLSWVHFHLFIGCGSWLNVCADDVRSSFHMNWRVHAAVRGTLNLHSTGSSNA